MEPLRQLLQDVSEMVKKYVLQVGEPALTEAFQDAEAELAVTATASQRPDATTTVNDRAGAAADRACARTPISSAPAEATPNPTAKANEARDARAAARAKRK